MQAQKEDNQVKELVGKLDATLSGLNELVRLWTIKTSYETSGGGAGNYHMTFQDGGGVPANVQDHAGISCHC